MALELAPLGTLTVRVAPPTRIAEVAVGTRLVFEIAEARWRGDGIELSQRGGAGGDWVAVGPDGTGTIDARFLLRSAEGAGLYLQLHGRVDLRGGPGVLPSYLAGALETDLPALREWNRALVVAKGIFTGDAIELEMHRLV